MSQLVGLSWCNQFKLLTCTSITSLEIERKKQRKSSSFCCDSDREIGNEMSTSAEQKEGHNSGHCSGGHSKRDLHSMPSLEVFSVDAAGCAYVTWSVCQSVCDLDIACSHKV